MFAEEASIAKTASELSLEELEDLALMSLADLKAKNWSASLEYFLKQHARVKPPVESTRGSEDSQAGNSERDPEFGDEFDSRNYGSHIPGRTRAATQHPFVDSRASLNPPRQTRPLDPNSRHSLHSNPVSRHREVGGYGSFTSTRPIEEKLNSLTSTYNEYMSYVSHQRMMRYKAQQDLVQPLHIGPVHLETQGRGGHRASVSSKQDP